MAKKMLIDATHAEETRVVVVDGNKVDEFDFESVNKRQLAGNIYLAKVTRVEPSLQAAFVDYGGNRHGFLAFSEIHPDYYQIPVADREALLAEEAAYAEAEDDDEADEPRKSRARRRSRSRDRNGETDEPKAKSRSRSRSKSNDGIEGMDVVDFGEEDEALDPAQPVSVIEDGDLPVVEAESEMPVPDHEDGDTEGGDNSDPDDVAIAEAEESVPAEAEAGEIAGEPAATEEVDTEKEPRGGTIAARVEDDGDRVVTAEVDAEIPEGVEDEAVAEAIAGPAEPVSEADATEGESDESVPEAPGPVEADADEPEAPEAETEADDEAGDEEDVDDGIESVAEEDVAEEIRRPRKPRMRRYKIQEVVKVRQIMLVQVVKEERGNKGAALTTYLSLAGRYCVLMPNTARGGGISRKITNAPDRKRLKEIAGEIDVPKGAGLIIRTAGAKRTKAEIKRDYEYLKRLWEQIRELTLKSIAPAPIYEEGNLIKRSIRDLYNRDIDEVFVEGEEGYRVAKDFMKMIMPSHAKHVKQYTDPMPLFARYQVESYLAGMFNPVVQLKSGGYIVIGITEALVAIDVNSGRATKEGSIEETALKTNLEAAEEVARQLRLRDLAGLIVIDFIDMDERRNNAAVEKRFKEKLKTDRARIQVGRISGFGLMEMSRQRLRPGMLEATTQPCPHCHGTGLLRSADSIGLQILRQLEEEGGRRRSREVLVRVPVGIANFLMNQKREHIAHIEAQYGMSVRIEADSSLVPPDFTMEKFKTATRWVPEVSTPVISVDTSDMPEFEEEEPVAEAEEASAENGDDGSQKKRRRRRRRRRGAGEGENGEGPQADSRADEAAEDDAGDRAEDAAEDAPAPETDDDAQKAPRKRRRRSRTRRSESAGEEAAAEAPSDSEGEDAGVVAESAADPVPDATGLEPEATEAADDLVQTEAQAADAEPLVAPVPEVAAEAPPVEVAVPAETDAAGPETAPVAAEAEDTGEIPVEAGFAEAADSPTEAAAVEVEIAVADLASEPPAGEPAQPKRRGWWSV
ncbi:Rne/Rng family ribonuclease [Tropicimonas sp.]|uniref:Rne/Rng family ribonuclease n=1 Tax=Tropicimonas sp. TaxID=2067044 RepID=UPI003A8A67F6